MVGSLQVSLWPGVSPVCRASCAVVVGQGRVRGLKLGRLGWGSPLAPLPTQEDSWVALPASLPPLPPLPPHPPHPRGLCVAGSRWWPLPGGPLQSLQKGSRQLASPEESGGRERWALGGV